MNEEMSEELKAEVLASQLPMICNMIQIVGIDYIKDAARLLSEKASLMDASAVLIRGYSPKKADLLREQALALDHITQFTESFDRCTELKTQLAIEGENYSKFEKLFGFLHSGMVGTWILIT